MNLLKKSLLLFVLCSYILFSGCAIEPQLAKSSSSTIEEPTEQNNEIDDEQKMMATQFVEMADEIMRQTKSIGDSREMYMAAANFDPSNIKANYMAGISHIDLQTLPQSKRAKGIEYLLTAYELNPDYKFDLLYKLGNGYHIKGDFSNAIAYYKKYTKKLNGDPNYIGEDLIDLEIVKSKIKQCKNGEVMN